MVANVDCCRRPVRHLSTLCPDEGRRADFCQRRSQLVAPCGRVPSVESKRYKFSKCRCRSGSMPTLGAESPLTVREDILVIMPARQALLTGHGVWSVRTMRFLMNAGPTQATSPARLPVRVLRTLRRACSAMQVFERRINSRTATRSRGSSFICAIWRFMSSDFW